MKKSLLLGALLVAGIVSAFPFRTSCNKIVEIQNSEGYSNSELAPILSGINQQVCGGGPVKVIFYMH